MLEKVNEFSKRLREHIDSTYSDLNDNMKGIIITNYYHHSYNYHHYYHYYRHHHHHHHRHHHMSELEGDITNLDAFIVKTSSTLSELQNYADNKTILSQMVMPSSSSSSSSLKIEKKSDDDNNVDRKYYSTVIRKS